VLCLKLIPHAIAYGIAQAEYVGRRNAEVSHVAFLSTLYHLVIA